MVQPCLRNLPLIVWIINVLCDLWTTTLMQFVYQLQPCSLPPVADAHLPVALNNNSRCSGLHLKKRVGTSYWLEYGINDEEYL